MANLVVLILLAVAAAPPPPATPPPAPAANNGFATAPVTAEMVVGAVDICMAQMRAAAFDGDALARKGWPLAVHTEDGGIRGYRHPDNMILLTMVAGREGRECLVMAPTGRGLMIEQMRGAMERQLGEGPKQGPEGQMWASGELSVSLKPMGGNVGVLIDVQPRNTDVHSR